MTRNLILITFILASAAAAQNRRPTYVNRNPRAATYAAVMRQNGFHVVKQNGENQCRWEKAKNWPAYQYQGAQRPNPDDLRPDPIPMVATPPVTPMPRSGEVIGRGRIANPPVASPVPGMTPRQITDVMTGRVFDHSLDDALENVFGNRPRR